MFPSAGILLLLAIVAVMEGVACAARRRAMHGWGWFLHAGHHRPRRGRREANMHAAIFAAPPFVLLLRGVQPGGGRAARGSTRESPLTARSASASTP